MLEWHGINRGKRERMWETERDNSVIFYCATSFVVIVFFSISKQIGHMSSLWRLRGDMEISVPSVMASWGVRWSSYKLSSEKEKKLNCTGKHKLTPSLSWLQSQAHFPRNSWKSNLRKAFRTKEAIQWKRRNELFAVT